MRLLDKEPRKDEEVVELENLKKIFENLQPKGKQLSIGKVSSSVYSNINGHKTSHGELKEQLTQNGKLIAKVSEKVDAAQEDDKEPKFNSQVEVDIPSKGIHKTIVKDEGNVEVIDGQDFSNNGQRRSKNIVDTGINKINAYAGLEYTPLDMAEYIFWTGDEKGVILAIEELLDEGLMSREEAINFLQAIKTNLDYMQEHYHGLQKTENRITNNGRSNIRNRLRNFEKPSFDYDAPQESEKMNEYDESSKYESPKINSYDRETKFQINGYDNGMKIKELGAQESLTERKKRIRDVIKPLDNKSGGVTLTDEDFEELLERLKVADYLYSEYSLEEVIYQLAKIVFSQSLARGSTDAQIALQRFTTFLEREARLGQISRSLEKKILDLLIAALSDTLTEHPELLSAVKENLGDPDTQAFSSSQILSNQIHGSGEKSVAAIRNMGNKSTKTSNIQIKEPTSKN